MGTISRGPAPALGPVDQAVGQALCDLRRELGLTQTVMAALLGVGASELIDYEQARQRAPAAFLLAVCQRLHVSPRRFYGETDSPSTAVPPSWTN